MVQSLLDTHCDESKWEYASELRSEGHSPESAAAIVDGIASNVADAPEPEEDTYQRNKDGSVTLITPTGGEHTFDPDYPDGVFIQEGYEGE